MHKLGHKSLHQGVELLPGPHRAEPAPPMAPLPSTHPAPRPRPKHHTAHLTLGQVEGKLPSVGRGKAGRGRVVLRSRSLTLGAGLTHGKMEGGVGSGTCEVRVEEGPG